MTRVVLSPEAVERLEAQIGYLQAQGAINAADSLRRRVMQFLAEHFAHFPRTRRYLSEQDAWESWIPRTRIVVWHRIENDHVLIATVWNTAQNRSGANP